MKIRKPRKAPRKTPNGPAKKRASRSAQGAAAAPGGKELVLAICHEVGNLLAATRLTAHLLNRDSGDPELSGSTRTIENLSAQAGSLLAHVRILLSDAPAARIRIAPRDLLEAVQRAQPRRDASARLRIASRIPAALGIEADPDAVHHALCALVDSAREAAGPAGSVRIGVERAGDRASFVVTDDGTPFVEEAETASLRRGRHLVLELARSVARRQGGDLRVRPLRRGTEVRLVLPCAPAARAASRGRAPAAGRAQRATRPRAATLPAEG